MLRLFLLLFALTIGASNNAFADKKSDALDFLKRTIPGTSNSTDQASAIIKRYGILPSAEKNLTSEERQKAIDLGRRWASWNSGTGQHDSFSYNRNNEYLGQWTVTYTLLENNIIRQVTSERCTRFSLALVLNVDKGPTYKGQLSLDKNKGEDLYCSFDPSIRKEPGQAPTDLVPQPPAQSSGSSM